MTNIEALLPCPFCGSDDVYIDEPYLNEMAYFVGHICCNVCEASVSNIYLSNSSNEAKESSIAVWNRRAAINTMKWIPIETAPKDGTRILCIEECGTKYVLFWNNGWECDLNIIASECFKPSHWMTIPKYDISTTTTEI